MSLLKKKYTIFFLLFFFIIWTEVKNIYYFYSQFEEICLTILYDVDAMIAFAIGESSLVSTRRDDTNMRSVYTHHDSRDLSK